MWSPTTTTPSLGARIVALESGLKKQEQSLQVAVEQVVKTTFEQQAMTAKTVETYHQGLEERVAAVEEGMRRLLADLTTYLKQVNSKLDSLAPPLEDVRIPRRTDRPEKPAPREAIAPAKSPQASHIKTGKRRKSNEVGARKHKKKKHHNDSLIEI